MKPLKKPCADCPFRRKGGVRLSAKRIEQIVGCVAPEDGQGGRFPCHKTTGVAGGKDRSNRSCAGGIIFGYKQGVSSQMTRIEERLGLIPKEFADGKWPEIFNDIDEMLETAI